jgi:hypothetical protein
VRLILTAALGMTVPLLAACGPVDVATPPASAAKACAALADGVPKTLLKEPSREVSPADAGAAWGDPAVVLSCGVDMPKEFTPGASCEEINGVGWYVPTDQFADERLDLTIYTIGRSPVVRVEIPSDYRSNVAFAGDTLSTLAPVIKKHTELEKPCI